MPPIVPRIVRGAVFCLTMAFAGLACAGGIDFTKVGRKDVFKDLPGVTMPDDPLKSKNVCTTMIRMEFFPAAGRRMPVRVYSCRQGNMIFESTAPPDEDAWRRYKLNQR